MPSLMFKPAALAVVTAMLTLAAAVPVEIISADVTADLPEHSFQWLFILTLIAAFVSAFAIGANDVANAFADAVAAGTLTLAQVVAIGFVTEFLGAVVLGNNTTSAIRKKIIDTSLFDERQDLLMWAMFCALVGAGTWVMTATALKVPVSTTHSIVGAVTGVGVAAFGVDGVDWSAENGVGRILIGFAISPVMASSVAAIFFLTTKYTVLCSKNSFKRALYATPVFAFFTTLIIMFFFVYKGSPKLNLDEASTAKQMAIIWPVVVAVTLAAAFVGIPYLKRKAQSATYQTEKLPTASDAKAIESSSGAQTIDLDNLDHFHDGGIVAIVPTAPKPTISEPWALFKYYFFYGINQDVCQIKSERQRKMLERAQAFEPKTEMVFQWLQIFSSAASSFAHGANDVANAIAPLATVFAIYSDGSVGSKADVPIWILVFGGVGIQMGLFFLGYRLMENLGNNLTFLSPSRGVCLEVAAILTVLTATALELPVSTTHCITGATIAVGLCEGSFKALNGPVVFMTLFGWVLTLPAAGLVAAALYSLGANAPNQAFVALSVNATIP